MLALIGFPPFSLFASELGIVRAGFAAGLGWVTAAALVLMLVIAAALLSHTSRMLLGARRSTRGHPATGPRRRRAPAAGPGGTVAPGASRSAWAGAPWRCAACAVLGIYAGPLTTLLHSAAAHPHGDTMTATAPLAAPAADRRVITPGELHWRRRRRCSTPGSGSR